MLFIIIFATSLVALILFLLFVHIEHIRGKRFFESTREKADVATIAAAAYVSKEVPKAGRALIKNVDMHAKVQVKRHAEKIHGVLEQQAKKISEQMRTNGSANGEDKQASAFIRDITAHKQKLREQQRGSSVDKEEV